MGYLKEKYTKTYFTGLDSDGNPAGYGIEGNYDGSESTLRDFDVQILDKVNFKNANILELGFGRGESIKYVMDKGAASYIGIDFAPPAFEMAQDFLLKNNIQKAKIHCCDALEFLQNQENQIPASINIVLLLDVLEHIPRNELSSILDILKKFLAEKAIFVINTPVYRFDNDVIANGIDERNHIDAIDHADFIEETKGMHCNKYSLISLQDYMKNNGYINITEAHLYAWDKNNHWLNNIESERIVPYSQLWDSAFQYGFPITKNYIPDVLEYAYLIKNPLEIILATQPMLEGLKFLGNKNTLEGFEDDGAIAYINEHIQRSKTIFDVGCYVGISALHFSRLVGKDGRVICFEPNKYNLTRIKNNFSLNESYIDNIHLYNYGLSDKNEVAEMLLSDDIESGHASASQLIRGGGIAIPKPELEKMGFFREMVQLKTLDTFVTETNIVPDFIKVDIEGAEVNFLRGGITTLATHKPTLFIELHNVFATCFVLKILTELGYSYHVLSEEWGNRAQIMAISDKNKRIALSDPVILDTLFDSYLSYKAKIYLENLEACSKNQTLEYQALQGQYRELQAQHQALKEKPAVIDNIKAKFKKNNVN